MSLLMRSSVFCKQQTAEAGSGALLLHDDDGEQAQPCFLIGSLMVVDRQGLASPQEAYERHLSLDRGKVKSLPDNIGSEMMIAHNCGTTTTYHHHQDRELA